MRVLLTGGTGFIGRHLIPLLLSSRHSLCLLVRDTPRARKALVAMGLSQEVVDSVSLHRWPSWQSPLPTEAFEGVEAVVHLLGENIGQGRWSAARKRVLRDSRVVSTETLVAAFPPSVKHFLCASAVGIYPASASSVASLRGDAAVEKDFPPEDNLPFLESLCRDWEDAARQSEDRVLRCVRMRIGLVLGQEGFLGELLPLFRLGLGGPIGDGRQMLPWIHISDLCRAMLWLLENNTLSGPVNLVGPNPVSFRTFGGVLAKLLKRPFVFRVPSVALKLALGEKSALPLASCQALPGKLSSSGFRFDYTMCSRALNEVLQD